MQTADQWPGNASRPWEVAECYVLGTLMLFGEGMEKCDRLDTRNFRRSEHQVLWRTVRALYDEGKPYTMDSVHLAIAATGDRERVSGKYIMDLCEAWGISTADLHVEADVLLNDRLLRELGETATDLASQAAEGADAAQLLEQAERDFLLLQAQRETRTEVSTKVMMREVMRAAQAQHDGGGLPGIATGYTHLDNALGGLANGALYILAARPAMGKTALALNMASNIMFASSPRSVVVFSLEMVHKELGQRLLAMRSRVPTQKPQKLYNVSDETRTMRAMDDIVKSPLTVIDSSLLTATELRAHARKLHAKKQLDVLIVDYLQLMTGDAESREREIGEISRSLKLIAKELSIPVLALSQLNRGVESRADKRPTLSDLRDSGSIEQDADVVLFLYRDEVYNENSDAKGKAEVLIAKNRHGPTTKCVLRFDGPTQRFDDLPF